MNTCFLVLILYVEFQNKVGYRVVTERLRPSIPREITVITDLPNAEYYRKGDTIRYCPKTESK